MTILESEDNSEPLDFGDDSFDWWGDCNLPDETILNTRLQRMVHDLCWIRYRLRVAALDSDINPETDAIFEAQLHQLHQLDAQLDEWFSELPDEWWPIVTTTEPREDVWNQTIYTFTSQILGETFILAYIARIIMHDKILQTSVRLGRSPPTASLYSIRAATDSFCAIVPWLFGCDALKDLVPDFRSDLIDPRTWLKIGITIAVRWLGVPAKCELGVPLEQRKWLKGRLDFTTTVIPYAHARILSQQIQV